MATERAEAFFLQRLQLHSRGLTNASLGDGALQSRRFDKVADDYLNLKRPALCDREWRNVRNLLTSGNGPASHFGRMDVGDITTDKLRQYLEAAERYSTSGKLSPHTLKRHLSLVSGILRLAAERQLIPSLPPMPKIKLKDEPRTWFTPYEYRDLLRSARQLTASSSSEVEGDELADWIGFMVNCFLRPSEWMAIRHRHIEVHRGEQAYLIIALEKGKTGQRLVWSMPSGVKIYDRIVSRSGSDPDQHVFLPQYPNRETAQHKMWQAFSRLLQHTGLTCDRLGKKRVPYSLRHSALMFRLLKGENVDLLALAKNAGTSIHMLERFYLSHLGPAMKLANLQSFKARQSV